MALNGDNIQFKVSVKQACIGLLQQRISNAKSAMEQAQETANNQEKSSAGDKYETSRAMGQLDRDMNARQLEQAIRELHLLEGIETDKIQTEINTGCVFELGNVVFYIAAGLGSITVKDQTVIVISPKSPFFVQARAKKTGDELLFQNRLQKIGFVY